MGALMELFEVVKSVYEVYSPVELGNEADRLIALSTLLEHNLRLYQEHEKGEKVSGWVKEVFKSKGLLWKAAEQEDIARMLGNIPPDA